MKAFPNPHLLNEKYFGMDLRDYFAAKAMEGIITATVTIDDTDYDENGLAELSYLIANAMMKARNK